MQACSHSVQTSTHSVDADSRTVQTFTHSAQASSHTVQAAPRSGSVASEHRPVAPQSETRNGQANCRNIFSVESFSGTLRGGGRRPRETNRGDADSDSIGDRLCNGDFVPLENGQSGDVRYRNTCWLAAVVNLCPVLLVIADVLGLRDRSWKETIHHARELA